MRGPRRTRGDLAQRLNAAVSTTRRWQGADCLAREARLAFSPLLVGAGLGSARRPRHEGGAGNNQSKRSEAQDALACAVAQSLTEDDDPAGDRREVPRGGGGGERRRAAASLAAARGGAE